MEVQVARTQVRFRRSINGAWVGDGREVSAFMIDENSLRPKALGNGYHMPFAIGSGISVTWPDGVTESAYPFNGGAFPGYPPICVPRDGRLSRLLND